MSVTYLQNDEKIQWKLLKELISQSMHFQPLFTRSSRRKMAKLKTYKFVKKYLFSIKLLHAHLQYVHNISAKCWKGSVKGLRGVDFTKYALLAIIY